MSGRKILRRFSSSISDLLSLQKRDASAGEEDEKLNTTPLHNAVQMGNAIMVANFVESRSIWIDEEDGKGRTALHYSMEQFSTDMASILLQNGANVDCVDFNGVSACHIACRDGMIDHFNLLLYYHADVCAIDKSGRTPFDLTCEFGHEKLMDRILTSGVKVECLQRAGDTHTMSALHLAAKNGHVQIVSKLIDHGWDLNRITDQGTALHVAAGFGRTQVVRFLLKAGIDVNGRNFYGQSAYEFAKKNSSKNPITYKEIRFLLKNSKSFVNAIAVKEHCGFKADELSFSPGDNIWVVERNDNGNWKGIVFGQKGNSRCGYFQSSTVAVEKKTPLTAHRVHKKSLSTTDLNLSMSSLSTRMAQSNAVPSTPMPLRHAVKPVPMPTVPMSTFHNPNNHFQQHHHSSSSSSSRSVSDIHYNNGLSTFGRAPSGLSDGSNDSRNGNRLEALKDLALNEAYRRFHSMSQSTFASYGHDANRNGTLTLNGQAMYPSTSALPAGLSPTSGESHRVSTGSNSSYGSSGFESMKCSNSSSSSFLQNSMLNESIGESNPCRSSVHSAGSAGGTSSSSSSGSSSLASTSVHTLDDSFHSASTTAPTPTNINVTQMVTNGVPQAEILANWLDGIGMSEYLSMFLKQGYDLYTIARCTPEDLLSLGIKNPEHRKKLIMDIHGWQIGDAWPNVIPMGGLREWLHQIALAEYVGVFEGQGYKMVQDVLNLTWEDFEDIGIKRLGHLKRLGLAVKKIKDHRRTLANLETVSSNHTQSIAQLSSPILPRGVDRSIASPSGGMNDPPPPAPTNNMEKKLGVHDKIDYISYARGNKVTPPPPPTRNPVPLENRRNVRSSYDALFAEDEPIRLNLVSTGKILSDISKMKDKERDYGFYDTDCPPPPAPLYCEANPLRLLPLRNSMCSNGSASSSDNLPFANENCGTIRAAKDSSKFDIPLTLPPMNIVDTSRDKMVKATDPDGFQEIDDMMQNLVGELDSMIMVNKEKGTTTAAAPIKSALKSEKK